MYKRNIPLRDIAYTVGLYGPKYKLFQALCTELGITTQEKVAEL
jgi:hypothetical protein